MQQVVGSITHLFFKPSHGVPMVPASSLDLRVGHGIEGDVNAHGMSPRQILLVRQEDLDEFATTPGALRENVVVAGLTSEVFVPGALLNIGNKASIRTTFLCEACKRIAHVVPSLKSIADKRGILGVILSNGPIQVRDHVTVQIGHFPPLSDVPFRRFLGFVSRIPPGRVVTYKQVVIGMGVAESYMRAIPMYIQRASAEEYPLHRILDSGGLLIPYVRYQSERLTAEGIQIIQRATLFGRDPEARVPLAQYVWHDPTVYLF